MKYRGIALQKRDSSLVSFTDPEEVARVRNNFLKKKLGLTNSDADLDKAIFGPSYPPSQALPAATDSL